MPIILSIVAFVVLSVVAGVKLGSAHIAGIKTERQQNEAAALFATGDMVRMKAFGHIGMVIRRDCWEVCTYAVRFSAIQSTTNTRVMGADSPIDVAPVSVVEGIHEYELESR